MTHGVASLLLPLKRMNQRGTRAGFITNAGLFGREMYTFTPTEGRNVTHGLIGISVAGVQKLDPTGFATGPWGGQYNVLRDIFNFKKSVDASATACRNGGSWNSEPSSRTRYPSSDATM